MAGNKLLMCTLSLPYSLIVCVGIIVGIVNNRIPGIGILELHTHVSHCSLCSAHSAASAPREKLISSEEFKIKHL